MLLFLIALDPWTMHAEVRLPRILGSRMVLQRDRPIHIWGWSDPGEKVSVSLNGSVQTTSGDNLGRWNIYLAPQSAGGPFQLTVTATNKVVLEDVLIGDVWFASGQSNMEMPLNGFPGSGVVNNAAEEIRNANQPGIRLFLARHATSDYPLNDFETDQGWTQCTPETAAKFSAVAYFFGREIAGRKHVPIGLIDSTWGGTVAEAWTSLEGIAAHPSLMPVFAERARMVADQADLPLRIAAEKREDAEALKTNAPRPQHSWHPDPRSWNPAALFNGMVAPATPFGIKGVIWYQGESNSALRRAPLYEHLFPVLIADWRRQWHEGEFPFLFVQISSFKSDATEDWPVIREAQRRTLALSHTAMAVTIDIGDPDNVHPADKQTVGLRLALGARAIAYHDNVEYSGPLFRQTSIEAGAARVWFDHAEGLTAKGGTLQGFEIAGDDGQFASATARIDGASVVVTNPQIPNPKYVRYGWQNAPTVNLYNAAGLPASPFTSEDEIRASR